MTYISEDGAFGGPVAVAAGHAEELARRGHQVDLLAGWDGKARLSIPGVNVGLFRARKVAPGLSGLTSIGLLSYLRAHAADYDAIHVHMGRDLVTLPAALLALSKGRRVFLQTHGMVMPDNRALAKAFDAALTRRALGRADSVFVLTDAEFDGVTAVAGETVTPVIARIPNGVATRGVSAERDVDPPVVLFLARLHPRKRVLAFAEAARELSESGVRATFRVIGPDEGDLAAFLAYKSEHRLNQLEYAGAIASGAAVEELSKATVYVLPSFGEVFPMTVLESFAAGTPVILTDECAIAPDLTARGCIEPTTGEPRDIARAITQLLDSSDRRAALVEAANDALTDWLAIGAVADRLEEAYA
ncbi:glycosyltransferase [Microbacterium allomyrinae]|uniref:Glycosyltransferase n=1 Tax=Microbacterium allomyrinae TaxID=2830666 RepID=A0A9X1LXW1_9MICO|nr:glycosyltransferase [Microbacterium allomyrinae]MCC2034057.1 glycosyltransferase [Microbacterium allomyrinae]